MIRAPILAMSIGLGGIVCMFLQMEMHERRRGKQGSLRTTRKAD